MTVLEAVLLGIVQGLTEFLPVSSSGHLILVPWALDIRYLQQHPEFNKTFDVALHVGTLAAVCAYFRRDIVWLARGGLSAAVNRRVRTGGERLAVVVAAASVPAAVVGAAGEDFIDKSLGQPWQVALLLAAFGLLLAYADRRPEQRGMRTIGLGDGVRIGFAQALALAPGVSRSGITITAGRLLGLDRAAAARFSFLLLVPVTAGAALLKGVGVAGDGIPPGAALPVLCGMAAAAISGFAAIAGMFAFLRRRSYDAFAVYRIAIAAAVLIAIAAELRPPDFGP